MVTLFLPFPFKQALISPFQQLYCAIGSQSSQQTFYAAFSAKISDNFEHTISSYLQTLSWLLLSNEKQSSLQSSQNCLQQPRQVPYFKFYPLITINLQYPHHTMSTMHLLIDIYISLKAKHSLQQLWLSYFNKLLLFSQSLEIIVRATSPFGEVTTKRIVVDQLTWLLEFILKRSAVDTFGIEEPKQSRPQEYIYEDCFANGHILFKSLTFQISIAKDSSSNLIILNSLNSSQVLQIQQKIEQIDQRPTLDIAETINLEPAINRANPTNFLRYFINFSSTFYQKQQTQKCITKDIIYNEMGTTACCQNQQKQEDFRAYCLQAAGGEYKGYLATIQHQEYNSSPQLVTQKKKFICGSWKKGESQTGLGVIFAPQQFYYEGQIVQGAAKGVGRIIWPSKFTYKGGIQDNKAAGNGELNMGQKVIVLKGIWARGFPLLNQKMQLNKQGLQGSITFVDLTSLKSQEEYFKETLNVVVAFDNNLSYEGEVRHNYGVYKIQGKGTMKYPDGSYYSGDFANGMMDGHGKYYWHKTKHWFSGEYKGNYREGKGTYYYSDTEFETGEWKGGVLLKVQASSHHESKSAVQKIVPLSYEQ